MTQPRKNVFELNDDPNGKVLSGINDLIDIFVKAEKAQHAKKIGVEHERFCSFKDLPLPYFGEISVEALLMCMAERAKNSKIAIPFEPVFEGDNVVALHFGSTWITLEPGGQFELSGSPFFSIHDVKWELERYEEQLRQCGEALNLNIMSLGYHPFANPSQTPLVPKSRYRIMDEHMVKVGTRGLEMMHTTCTVQANLDHSSEKDFVHSMQAAFAVSPLVMGIFASSPFKNGKPSGAKSERALVWQDVDAARTGCPDIIFENDFGYERWVDYVLNVPMYFIRRGDVYIDATHLTFKQFLNSGYLSYKATLQDFKDHLTTIFTEVRAKPFLEMRSADCGPLPMLLALPAVWKGLLYDERAKDLALDLMDNPKAQELRELQIAIARFGFDATYRGKGVHKLCEALLQIASDGLQRQAIRNENNDDESIFLKPVNDLVANKMSLSDQLLFLYQNDWQGDLAKIWQSPFVL